MCGKAAVTFELGEQLPGGETSLLCKGNIWQQSFSRALAETMFALLDEGRVRDVHACLIETGECREGVDAYCPDCDRVYCRLHYDCVDEYDEGFYDCTYGTCPAGHRRRVAD